MKGLKKYIAKHGKHFTVELAERVIPIKWNASNIKESTRDEVYYNVISATLGDMVYLANVVYSKYGAHKFKCLAVMYDIVGDYNYYDKPFEGWLEDVRDFDFTAYI